MESYKSRKSNAHKIKNSNRYCSGEIVDNYMQEPYHSARVDQAIRLINLYICNNFSKYNHYAVNVLEIAGSIGHVSNRLSAMGYSVLLTDSEELPLEIARQRNAHIKTLVMDASGPFPFSDNSFHVVYAGDIIEHLYDTSLFLQEIHRCLVPNGILVLTTPNLASLEDRIGFLFGKSPRQVNPTHEFLSLHIRPFTYSKLREIMGSVGFSNFTLATNLIRLKLGPYKRDLFFLSKYFPSLGRSLIVAANADKEIHND